MTDICSILIDYSRFRFQYTGKSALVQIVCCFSFSRQKNQSDSEEVYQLSKTEMLQNCQSINHRDHRVQQGKNPLNVFQTRSLEMKSTLLNEKV